MGRFEDRVAVVTGAGSGLGAAIATRLATEGASVVCVDLTDAAAAGTAELLGDRGRAVRVDVADGGDVARLLGEVRKATAAWTPCSRAAAARCQARRSACRSRSRMVVSARWAARRAVKVAPL